MARALRLPLMLARLFLTCTGSIAPEALIATVQRALLQASEAFGKLPLALRTSALPHEASVLPQRSGQDVLVSVSRWANAASDPSEIDVLVENAASKGRFSITLYDWAAATEAEMAAAAVQVVTRCQRFVPMQNRASASELFERVMLTHRRAHDLTKPLVSADFAHSLDTTRWVLRLEPEASLEVQIAALLHDVERLVTECDRRIEHHADDYAAFKNAHAEQGAVLAQQLLDDAEVPMHVAARVVQLISAHETLGADRDLILLNEADALSFFSLNASGFVNYYGAAHTRKKVRYTLGRLRARGRAQLASIRHPALIQALLSGAPGAEGLATPIHRDAV